MGQMNNQTRVFKIKIILLIILIKDRTSKKVKFTRILYIFKVGYNLVLNRRFCVYKYYFYGGDDMIRRMNNNSKLIFVSFIEKGLHELLLVEPRVHYALRESLINVEIWY